MTLIFIEYITNHILITSCLHSVRYQILMCRQMFCVSDFAALPLTMTASVIEYRIQFSSRSKMLSPAQCVLINLSLTFDLFSCVDQVSTRFCSANNSKTSTSDRFNYFIFLWNFKTTRAIC